MLESSHLLIFENASEAQFERVKLEQAAISQLSHRNKQCTKRGVADRGYAMT